MIIYQTIIIIELIAVLFVGHMLKISVKELIEYKDRVDSLAIQLEASKNFISELIEESNDHECILKSSIDELCIELEFKMEMLKELEKI